MTTFCLVASDSENETGAVSGDTIAYRRLTEARWPLYHRTRNRKIVLPGDRLLIYAGGTGRVRQSIIASGIVDSIVTPGRYAELEPEIRLETVLSIINLSSVVLFDIPVPIREVLPAMDICPKNLNKWGVIFFGGCRKLSDHDYNLILSTNQNHTPATQQLGYQPPRAQKAPTQTRRGG